MTTYKMTSQIFLKTTTGRTVVMDVDLTTATIGDVKNYYYAQEGLPVQFQRIIAGTKQLDVDSMLLSEAKVVKDYTLHILLRVHGDNPLAMGNVTR